MKAEFNLQSDDNKFEQLAPTLAKHPAIISSHGVLNVAQCAQINGEEEECWSFEYLLEHFRGTTGISHFEHAVEAELQACWDAALISPRK